MTQYFVCPVSHSTVYSTGSGQEPPIDSDGVTLCVEVTEEEYYQQVAENEAAAEQTRLEAEASPAYLAALGIGKVEAFVSAIPETHLLADGSKFSKKDYPLLFTYLGGITLPNLKAQFVGEEGNYALVYAVKGR